MAPFLSQAAWMLFYGLCGNSVSLTIVITQDYLLKSELIFFLKAE